MGSGFFPSLGHQAGETHEKQADLLGLASLPEFQDDPDVQAALSG